MLTDNLGVYDYKGVFGRQWDRVGSEVMTLVGLSVYLPPLWSPQGPYTLV